MRKRAQLLGFCVCFLWRRDRENEIQIERERERWRRWSRFVKYVLNRLKNPTAFCNPEADKRISLADRNLLFCDDRLNIAASSQFPRVRLANGLCFCCWMRKCVEKCIFNFTNQNKNRNLSAHELNVQATQVSQCAEDVLPSICAY